jgi:hypothetical protein
VQLAGLQSARAASKARVRRGRSPAADPVSCVTVSVTHRTLIARAGVAGVSTHTHTFIVCDSVCVVVYCYQLCNHAHIWVFIYICVHSAAPADRSEHLITLIHCACRLHSFWLFASADPSPIYGYTGGWTVF